MANFERARLCKAGEFDYFKQERKSLEQLEVGALYVAMWSLKKMVDNHGAAKIPLLIAEIDEATVLFQPFNRPDKPEDVKLQFKIAANNFIATDTIKIYGVRPERGYLRDHHEGLDGPAPEIDVAETVTHRNHIRTEPIYA